MIRLTPPTVPRVVSSGWGSPRDYRGGWHAGLDFPARKGTPILAAAPGTVVFVKNIDNSFAGKHTVIDHGGGVYSRYLHADSNLKKVGDRVRRGEKIGTVGTTGTKRSGPHVHFDVKFSPAAIVEYEKLFGRPTTGFGAKMVRFGRGAPVEAIMDRAKYRPGVLMSSAKRGVKFFKSSPASTALGLLLAAGFGWAVYSYLR